MASLHGKQEVPSIAARRTGSTNSTEAGRIAEQHYSSAKIPRSVPYLLRGTHCSGIRAAGEGKRTAGPPKVECFSEHAFSTAPGGKTVSRQMNSTERDRWFESVFLQRRVCEPSVPESPRLRSPHQNPDRDIVRAHVAGRAARVESCRADRSVRDVRPGVLVERTC
jgi:hypothetical protein